MVAQELSASGAVSGDDDDETLKTATHTPGTQGAAARPPKKVEDMGVIKTPCCGGMSARSGRPLQRRLSRARASLVERGGGGARHASARARNDDSTGKFSLLSSPFSSPLVPLLSPKLSSRQVPTAAATTTHDGRRSARAAAAPSAFRRPRRRAARARRARRAPAHQPERGRRGRACCGALRQALCAARGLGSAGGAAGRLPAGWR